VTQNNTNDLPDPTSKPKGEILEPQYSLQNEAVPNWNFPRQDFGQRFTQMPQILFLNLLSVFICEICVPLINLSV
jgi:hypothetical protein